jgi:hypothetical protein
MPAFTVSLSTGVGDIAAAQPLLAGAFAVRQLDPATVAVLLDAAAHLGASTPPVDAASMTLTALADHIESTHHADSKQELPASSGPGCALIGARRLTHFRWTGTGGIDPSGGRMGNLPGLRGGIGPTA